MKFSWGNMTDLIFQVKVRWPHFFDHLTFVQLSWSCGQEVLIKAMATIFLTTVGMVKWSKF